MGQELTRLRLDFLERKDIHSVPVQVCVQAAVLLPACSRGFHGFELVNQQHGNAALVCIAKEGAILETSVNYQHSIVLTCLVEGLLKVRILDFSKSPLLSLNLASALQCAAVKSCWLDAIDTHRILPCRAWQIEHSNDLLSRRHWQGGL